MSFLQLNTFATSLMKQTTVNIILPDDAPPLLTMGNSHYQRPAKTLFLLHGFSGNMHDWMIGSSIQDLALKYNLAVVMPSGDNSFYLNGRGTGRLYADYIGKELVDYMRKTFGLAMKKEDTFVGGLSMGGFGALHTGLQFYENFGKIAALSSALIIHEIKNQKPGFYNGIADYEYFASTFGDLERVEESENNPEYLIKQLKKRGEDIPAIYMACGTEDFLLENNRQMHVFLEQEQVNVIYEEGPGAHDWDFWNSHLESSICWLLECKSWALVPPNNIQEILENNI